MLELLGVVFRNFKIRIGFVFFGYYFVDCEKNKLKELVRCFYYFILLIKCNSIKFYLM